MSVIPMVFMEFGGIGIVSLIVGIIWMNSIGKHNFGTYEYVTSLMVGLLVTTIVLSIICVEIAYNPQTVWFLLGVSIILLAVVFSITGLIAASSHSPSQLIWVTATIIWLLSVLGFMSWFYDAITTHRDYQSI